MMQGVLLTHGHANREDVKTAYERAGDTADNKTYSLHCAVCDFIVQQGYDLSTSIFSFKLFARLLFCWLLKEVAFSARLLSLSMQGRSPPTITASNYVG